MSVELLQKLEQESDNQEIFGEPILEENVFLNVDVWMAALLVQLTPDDEVLLNLE